MILTFKEKQVNISDDDVNEYRQATGMDINDSYILYCASNEGVVCENMTSSEISTLVKKMMNYEIRIAKK